MVVDSAVMAYFNMHGIDKVNATGAAQAPGFQKQHHRYSHPLLQFNKAVIRYQARKTVLVVAADITKIKVLEVSEITAVKGH